MLEFIVLYVTVQKFIQVKLFNLGWFSISFQLFPSPNSWILGLGEKGNWESTLVKKI